MAVQDLVLAWDEGIRSSVDSNGKVMRTANRGYTSTVDDVNNTALDVLIYAAQQGVFEQGPHPDYGPDYLCNNIRVVKESPIFYKVQADYKTTEFEAGEDPDLPWNQPAIVDTQDIVTDFPLEEDINGNPIVTTAGEPIIGLTRPVSDLRLIIKKNFLSFSSAAYYTYKDAVNSDTFLGFPPGVCRVTGLPSTEQTYENGQKYSTVTGTIDVRKPYRTTEANAWHKRVLNQGWYARPAAGEPVKRATFTPDGDYTSIQVLLDQDGVMLEWNPETKTFKGTPHWLEFEVFESVAFAGMGFF